MPDRTRVLIIDDEVEASTLLGMHLERDGYLVDIANSGMEGLRLASQNPPDAVILDIRMPGMDGHEVCGRLRDIGDAAILFVTVVRENDAIIRGLQAGADDYLIKPFHYPELAARMEACLRRRSLQREAGEHAKATASPWSLDAERREVVHGSQRVQLTPKEFELLQFFLQNPDKVLAADEILENLWGPGYVGDPDLVKQFVYRLRTKLEKNPSEPRYLITVRGSGYAFEPDTKPSLKRPVLTEPAPPEAASGLFLTEPDPVSAFRQRARSWRARREGSPVAGSERHLGSTARRGPSGRETYGARASHAPEKRRAGTLRLRLSLVISIAIASLVAGAVVANASAAALPGDGLYPLKLALEGVQLLLAPGEARDLELRIAFSHERVGEMGALIGAERPEDILEAVAQYEHNLDASSRLLERIAAAGSGKREDGMAMAMLQALLAQVETLSGLVGLASPESEAALARALRASQAGLAGVQDLMLSGVEPVPASSLEEPAEASAAVDGTPSGAAADAEASSAGPPDGDDPQSSQGASDGTPGRDGPDDEEGRPGHPFPGQGGRPPTATPSNHSP